MPQKWRDNGQKKVPKKGPKWSKAAQNGVKTRPKRAQHDAKTMPK